MIDGVPDLADDEQVVLAQEIVDIVNAARLRVFDRHEAILDLAGGDGAENIGEGAIGYRFGPRMRFPGVSTKICLHRFVAECAALALKGDGGGHYGAGGFRLHYTVISRFVDCIECSMPLTPRSMPVAIVPAYTWLVKGGTIKRRATFTSPFFFIGRRIIARRSESCDSTSCRSQRLSQAVVPAA